MKAIERTTRTLQLDGLKALPAEKPTQVLCQMRAENSAIEVLSETITIVLSRDVRKNTRLSADIAVAISQQAADRDVWYINTFAGVRLLQESFAHAMGGTPVTQFDEDALPNLRILDFPLGEWKTSEIAEDIEKNGRESAAPVLVLNAFEFAWLTRGGRERVARELIKLREQFDLTIVVFSQEMKRDVEPGLAARGALGILAPCAHTVVRLPDPFEHLMGHKQSEKGTVHEEETRLERSETESQPVSSREKNRLASATKKHNYVEDPMTFRTFDDILRAERRNGHAPMRNGTRKAVAA